MSTPNGKPIAAWSRLAHVGAHAGRGDLCPTLAELDLDIVRVACDTAWVYSRADFEPYLNVLLTESQWRETCALAGSMAESLMLSSVTYIETVWHKRLLEADLESGGMAIAQRYLADNAIDTAVSVGHRLINFVARVARTDPATSERLGEAQGLALLGPTYKPFVTDDTKAWLALNPDAVRKLRKALPAVHRPALDILKQLSTSPEWKAMHAIRGENFHRWRKEHESVVGVDAHSGHEHDNFDDAGNWTGRSGGGQGRPHTLGDGLTEKTTDAAGEGLRVVAEALKGIIEHTLAVLPTVTGGFEVTYDGKKLKKTRQIIGPRATAPAVVDNADHGSAPSFTTRLARSVTSHAVTLAVLAVRRVRADDTKTGRGKGEGPT